MSDETERTLCQLPQVHVFKIPVRKSADGHRASDWPKDPTWTGKVKIVAKGRVAAIILLDDKNQVFAVCQVTDDSAVERTLDSGRYFVLRITNAQGRHAFIGIAFNERNDAFDFNVALAEFKSELEREDQAVKMGDLPVGPMKDLSLKEGEKIKIKILPKKKQADEGGSSPSPAAAISGSKPATGILPPPKAHLLPPPTSASSSGSQQSAAKLPADNSWADSSDPFGQSAFSSSGTAHTAGSDPFGASPFGSDPFGTTTVGTDPFGGANAGTKTAQTVFTKSTGLERTSANKPAQAGASKEVNLLDL